MAAAQMGMRSATTCRPAHSHSTVGTMGFRPVCSATARVADMYDGPRDHRTSMGFRPACAATRVADMPAGVQFSRRELVLLPLAGVALLPAAAAWADEDPAPGKFFKTPSGIKIQELQQGTGATPQNGDLVLIDYVLRRPNGYFIYSTVEGVSFQPRDIPIGPVAFKLGVDADWIQGIQEVVAGMKQGGKLRALIPPELGYVNCDKDQPQPPTYATKRQLVNHCKEPLLFEVALLRVTPAK